MTLKFENQEGCKKGGEDGDIFRSAAYYYSKYRRPYPEAVVSSLVERLGLNGKGRLLDVGCGTGQVFQVMAQYFEEVIAIDADVVMVKYANDTAIGLGLNHVKVFKMRAEDIDEELGKFRIATFGASFHWMKRQYIGNLIYKRLEPNGHIVLLCPGDFQSGDTIWEAEIRNAISNWLGSERRAGGGIYRPQDCHEIVLQRTRFSDIQINNIDLRVQWSIDQIIGYLFSTSYASKAVLGEKAKDFECDMRERLVRLQPDGYFEKIVQYTDITAKRRA